jgi:hypothetical protein
LQQVDPLICELVHYRELIQQRMQQQEQQRSLFDTFPENAQPASLTTFLILLIPSALCLAQAEPRQVSAAETQELSPHEKGSSPAPKYKIASISHLAPEGREERAR